MNGEPRYSLDSLPGTFEDRVFLGGSYTHGMLIEEMVEAVKDCGMTPIVARWFGIEPEITRDSVEYLMLECKFAIIECSSGVGNLVEVEIAYQLGMKNTLCLWDASMSNKHKITPMTTSNLLFKRNSRYYKGKKGLYDEVYKFLRQQ